MDAAGGERQMSPLDARYAEWVDRRACGTCTACCFVFQVAATDSPPYSWCKHCTPGVGCGIYAERPPECAGFYCLWRMGFGDDADRPGREGVVMGMEVDAVGRLIVQVWRPRQFQERKLRSAKRMQRQVWEKLTADGYDVVLEVHGPPPSKILRWDPREMHHASDE